MTMVAAPALCREPLLQAWPQPHLFLQLFRSSSPHSTDRAGEWFAAFSQKVSLDQSSPKEGVKEDQDVG
jgi:hypothetical protein